MKPQLIATGTTTSRGRGRPAELFRRREIKQSPRHAKV
jgi:hypothetical protein